MKKVLVLLLFMVLTFGLVFAGLSGEMYSYFSFDIDELDYYGPVTEVFFNGSASYAPSIKSVTNKVVGSGDVYIDVAATLSAGISSTASASFGALGNYAGFYKGTYRLGVNTSTFGNYFGLSARLTKAQIVGPNWKLNLISGPKAVNLASGPSFDAVMYTDLYEVIGSGNEMIQPLNEDEYDKDGRVTYYNYVGEKFAKYDYTYALAEEYYEGATFSLDNVGSISLYGSGSLKNIENDTDVAATIQTDRLGEKFFFQIGASASYKTCYETDDVFLAGASTKFGVDTELFVLSIAGDLGFDYFKLKNALEAAGAEGATPEALYEAFDPEISVKIASENEYVPISIEAYYAKRAIAEWNEILVSTAVRKSNLYLTRITNSGSVQYNYTDPDSGLSQVASRKLEAHNRLSGQAKIQIPAIGLTLTATARNVLNDTNAIMWVCRDADVASDWTIDGRSIDFALKIKPASAFSFEAGWYDFFGDLDKHYLEDGEIDGLFFNINFKIKKAFSITLFGDRLEPDSYDKTVAIDTTINVKDAFKIMLGGMLEFDVDYTDMANTFQMNTFQAYVGTKTNIADVVSLDTMVNYIISDFATMDQKLGVYAELYSKVLVDKATIGLAFNSLDDDDWNHFASNNILDSTIGMVTAYCDVKF